MKRGLIGVLALLFFATPAAADIGYEKAIGLKVVEPLSVDSAARGADRAGYEQVFGWRRLSPRSIRLRAGHATSDVYEDDILVGHLYRTAVLTVERLHSGRLTVWARGRPLPTPD